MFNQLKEGQTMKNQVKMKLFVFLIGMLLLVSCSTSHRTSNYSSHNSGTDNRQTMNYLESLYKASFTEATRTGDKLFVVFKDPVNDLFDLTPELAAKILGGLAIMYKDAKEDDVLMVAFFNNSNKATAYYVSTTDFKKYLNNQITAYQLGERLNYLKDPIDINDYVQTRF